MNYLYSLGVCSVLGHQDELYDMAKECIWENSCKN